MEGFIDYDFELDDDYIVPFPDIHPDKYAHKEVVLEYKELLNSKVCSYTMIELRQKEGQLELIKDIAGEKAVDFDSIAYRKYSAIREEAFDTAYKKRDNNERKAAIIAKRQAIKRNQEQIRLLLWETKALQGGIISEKWRLEEHEGETVPEEEEECPEWDSDDDRECEELAEKQMGIIRGPSDMDRMMASWK